MAPCSLTGWSNRWRVKYMFVPEACYQGLWFRHSLTNEELDNSTSLQDEQMIRERLQLLQGLLARLTSQQHVPLLTLNPHRDIVCINPGNHDTWALKGGRPLLTTKQRCRPVSRLSTHDVSGAGRCWRLRRRATMQVPQGVLASSAESHREGGRICSVQFVDM